MTGKSGPEEKILAVIGLGNPGKQYEGSRHNAGFQVVDELVRKWGVLLQERKFRASWGTASAGGGKIVLVKPLTYMNRSGEAVGEIIRYFGIPAGAMLVVHDDLDLPLGRIKVAAHGGGAGGHRGLLSIMEHVGNREFPRVKLGVGRPLFGEPIESFVLMSPYSADQKDFEEMVTRGAEVVLEIIAAGLDAAANRFNRKNTL
jgi:PTH1 family peptidyl-tRNA hydrolase